MPRQKREPKPGVHPQMIFSEAGADVEIAVPFRVDFNTALKECVRSDHRSWDEDRAVWIVKQPYCETAASLVRTFFPGVVEAKLGEV